MMKDYLRSLGIATAFLSSLSWADDPIILIPPLSQAPQLDGQVDAFWQAAPVQRVTLRPNSEFEAPDPVTEVLLRAGHFQGRVYFLLEWADAAEGRQHKPFVWDKARNKYVRGAQREDRLALQFRIAGDYQADWLASTGFTADIWHWKASRSDPLGLADDKWTKVSRDRLIRSSKVSQGQTHIYVLRQWDEGEPLYTTRRYRKYAGDIKPKYILNPELESGSTTDVKAASHWAQGRWVLELSRKLDTGHSDDARFELGQVVLGGLSVFNQSESEQHFISSTQRFHFLP